MKLGFYYHITLHRNSEGIMMPSFLGVFLDSIAPLVTELIIFGHEAKLAEMQACDYCLKSKNIQWINLGPKTPFWDRVLFPGKSFTKIKKRLAACDYILVRAPSPLAPYFYLKYKNKARIVYMMVGDYIEGLKAETQRIHRRIPIFILTYLNEYLQNRAIRNCVTFVNSRLLFNKYKNLTKNLYEIRTTTLTLSDFYFRNDSFGDYSAPINILFTGRISFSKGVLEIIRAAEALISTDKDIFVHYVGWEDNTDRPVEGEIKKEAVRLGIEKRVFFHGKKSVGPDLFNMYRGAQIYILPSKSDFEGFPRTIWEAMANCTPVLTTSVGSIPHFLENEKHALIVEPRNIETLVSALKRLIENEQLRRYLIANAYDYVKDITLEVQSGIMIKKLKALTND